MKKDLNRLYYALKYRYGSLLPFIFGVIFFIGVFAYGIVIYSVVEGWPLSDSFYQVVITLSTVGFQETYALTDRGRMLTSILILLGVGTFAYLVGTFTQVLVEGKLQDVLGRRRVQKFIDSLENHVIVCGFGRIGSVVVEELMREGWSVVVVENSPTLIENFEKEGILYVFGDATSDDVLVRAGVGRAKYLITCLTQAAENVYVTLTARELHPEMSIVARADRGDSIQKLKRAGANKVLTPHMIGGKRMAQMILRPTVTDFIDLAMQGHDLQMEEFKVDADSCLAGKDLIASGIRPRYNLIIIAIEKDSGRMVFNPQPDEVISQGDTLVLVGKRESFRKLQKDCIL